MGLTAGLVPPRVDAGVKAGLLDLVTHAVDEGGWSLRRAAAVLGLDHVRVLRWQTRATLGELADRPPGPDVPLHALLDHERAAIVKLAEQWGEIDRSHRKLAHRGSRLEVVHVSESTAGRVLTAEGIVLPAGEQREPLPARPWPDWAELVPGVIWIYDFTHFQASRRVAVAVPGVVSRWWPSTVVSAQESSTQVEVAFTRALVSDGKQHLLDQQLREELACGVVPDHDELPVLLALSDNAPADDVALDEGVPGRRPDRHPLRAARDPERPGLDRVVLRPTSPASTRTWTRSATPASWNSNWAGSRRSTTPLHEDLGYATPDDEHHGRGPAVRAARRAGLDTARSLRIATRRDLGKDHP